MIDFSLNFIKNKKGGKMRYFLLLVLPFFISSTPYLSSKISNNYCYVSIFDLLGAESKFVSSIFIDDDDTIWMIGACFLTGCLLGWAMTEFAEFIH